MGWLDAAAFALFVGLALLLAAQLVRGRSARADGASAVLHLTMAVGMASMSQPRLDPLAPEVWMLAFVAMAAGTLVLCVGRRGRGDRPLTRPYDHLVASLLMVVVFAGHGPGHGPGPGTNVPLCSRPRPCAPNALPRTGTPIRTPVASVVPEPPRVPPPRRGSWGEREVGARWAGN